MIKMGEFEKRIKQVYRDLASEIIGNLTANNTLDLIIIKAKEEFPEKICQEYCYYWNFASFSCNLPILSDKRKHCPKNWFNKWLVIKC